MAGGARRIVYLRLTIDVLCLFDPQSVALATIEKWGEASIFRCAAGMFVYVLEVVSFRALHRLGD